MSNYRRTDTVPRRSDCLRNKPTDRTMVELARWVPYREVEEHDGDAGEEADEAGCERDEVAAGRRVLDCLLHRLLPTRGGPGLLVRRAAPNNPQAARAAAASARQPHGAAAAAAAEPEESGRGLGRGEEEARGGAGGGGGGGSGWRHWGF